MSTVRRAVTIYACAFAVASATPFLLLPILTQRLSPAQFGEVTSFLIFTALIGNVAGLSSHGFVAVRYFKEPPEQFSLLVSNAVTVLAASHTFILAAALVLHALIARALDLPLGTTLLAVVSALFLNLNLLWLAIFQSSDQPVRYLQARMIQGGIELGLCVALLFLVVIGADARTWSYSAALAASAFFGWLHCRRRGHVGGGFDRTHIKELLAFGLPMLPHIVAGSSIIYIDRLFVSSLLGAESLGVYMVAMQIGMVMLALIEPLNKALAPWLFGQLSKSDIAVSSMIVRRTYLIYVGLSVLGLLVTGIAHLLFDTLISAKFVAARALVPWMVGGFVLQGMYYSVVNYLFYAERTGWLSMASAGAATFGCMSSYLLTSRLGLVGAAASFVLNNAVLFALVWLMAAKAVPMPWFRRRRG